MQGAQERRQDPPRPKRVVEPPHARGQIVQRHVLYLGEINDAQRAAWCKTIEVVEAGRDATTQMAIFPKISPGTGTAWSR